MNATQLEALVIAAVDAVKAGVKPEDDRIEFKRGWPSVDKARQLAATANQALGDHVIYVIGVDDKTGTVYPLDDTDPATWWAQIESRFNEVTPDLIRHLGIQISDSERVVALLFQTDRAPYVVKVGAEGGGELEVPIRAGTRTRSAKRHELIRMLYPAVSVPSLTGISGLLSMTPQFEDGAFTELSFWTRAQVMFEPVPGNAVFLPWHTASATIEVDGAHVDGEVRTYIAKDGHPSNAVHVRRDGIRVSEPGAAFVQAMWAFPMKRARDFREVERWTIRFAFGVSGTSRRAEVVLNFENRKRGQFVLPMQSRDQDLREWSWSFGG